MANLAITPDDVRNLLQVDSNEVTDGYLNSPAMVPFCNARVNQLLNDGYDDLDANQKIFAQSVAINLCAVRIVLSPSFKEAFTEGPFSLRSYTDFKARVKEYQNNASEGMKLLGLSRPKRRAGTITSGDWMPDGHDARNLSQFDNTSGSTSLTE